MDYSLIKPKKDKELIRYYHNQELVGVFDRRPSRYKRFNRLTRKQFENQLENKLINQG
jgi:hypothetical protein